MDKIAIYTAVFGDKDNLIEPLGFKENDNIDYYLITDNIKIKSNVYKTILVKRKNIDLVKDARYYKILGIEYIFRKYDVLIWHDANIQIKYEKIDQLISFLGDNFLAVFKHPERNNFYQEALACIDYNRDFSLRILFQSIIYFLKGVPANSELFETGILVKKNKMNKKFFATWWKEISKFSRRDQLSLAYVVWKSKAEVSLLPGAGASNKFSIYRTHNFVNNLSKRNIVNYDTVFFKRISKKIISYLESCR